MGVDYGAARANLESWGAMQPSSAAIPFALVLLRLGLGALLLHESSQLWAQGIGPWIVEETAERIVGAPEWYATFANKLVYRFPELFARLIAGGTLLGGVALFIGAAVRPACVGVVFLMANALMVGPRAEREYIALVGLAAVTCLLGNAGVRMGADAWLPSWLSWTSAGGGRGKGSKNAGHKPGAPQDA